MTIEEQVDSVLESATPEQIRSLLICIIQNGRIPDLIFMNHPRDPYVGVMYGKIMTGIEPNGHTHQ